MDRIDGLQSVDSAIRNLETAPVSIRRLRVMFGQIGFLEGTEQRQGRDRPFALESDGSLGYDGGAAVDHWQISVVAYR